MKTSMRKTFAILFLSGTTALAGPVFAQQQADPNNPQILPQGQGQGSAETQGNAETQGGSAEGGAGANATTETQEGGSTDPNTAQSDSGSASGETETQTTQTPTDNNAEQGTAQSSDGAADKTKRKSTAESGQAAEDGSSTDNAKSTAEGESESESTAESSTSNETTASIDITTEQRTEIHNVISESDAKPVDIDVEVDVGAVVPRTVELRPLPPRIIEIVPAYRAYKYILLADGRILIIEPETLKIVYVITA